MLEKSFYFQIKKKTTKKKTNSGTKVQRVYLSLC